MFGIGATELIIILVIVLVIYGGKRLPELGSSFGKAIRNFRGAGAEPDEIDVTPGKTPAATPGPEDKKPDPDKKTSA
jgi:sec-independent protein translocase protein TatA